MYISYELYELYELYISYELYDLCELYISYELYDLLLRYYIVNKIFRVDKILRVDKIFILFDKYSKMNQRIDLNQFDYHILYSHTLLYKGIKYDSERLTGTLTGEPFTYFSLEPNVTCGYVTLTESKGRSYIGTYYNTKQLKLMKVSSIKNHKLIGKILESQNPNLLDYWNLAFRVSENNTIARSSFGPVDTMISNFLCDLGFDGYYGSGDMLYFEAETRKLTDKYFHEEVMICKGKTAGIVFDSAALIQSGLDFEDVVNIEELIDFYLTNKNKRIYQQITNIIKSAPEEEDTEEY